MFEYTTETDYDSVGLIVYKRNLNDIKMFSKSLFNLKEEILKLLLNIYSQSLGKIKKYVSKSGFLGSRRVT